MMSISPTKGRGEFPEETRLDTGCHLHGVEGGSPQWKQLGIELCSLHREGLLFLTPVHVNCTGDKSEKENSPKCCVLWCP